MTDSTRHPAKFNDDVLDAIVNLLPDQHLYILDPFAGVGKVHELRGRNPKWKTIGVELEPEWATQSVYTVVGNALDLECVIPDVGYPLFDAIVTSPTYGNRFADTYVGPPDRVSHTYRLYLGRDLSPESSASLQWGTKYRVFHRLAWAEATRVCKPDALFILNIKDHIRDSRVVPVTAFHVRALRNLGWQVDKRIVVPVGGHRHGENHEARVEFESVIRFTRKYAW